MTLSNADQQACSRFQSGLLAWLRAADDPSGLREMVAVVRAQALEDSANALLWRSAEAFLQALLDGTLSADIEARQLCRRLERQLGRGAPTSEAGADPSDLRAALFAYVSNRAPTLSPGELDAGPEARSPLAQTLCAAADVLPLMTPDPAQSRRFSDAQVAAWREAANHLETAWQSRLTGEPAAAREAATRLVAVALELSDPPGLALAEALADAVGQADNQALLERPAFRAAVAAALETARATDGPDQKAFEPKVSQAVRRLNENRRPVDRRILVGGPKPWFAEDAREWLDELHSALDAVPPRRAALIAGIEWLAQQDACSMMAIRGLATLALKVVLQVRAEDLDVADTHNLLRRVLESLEHAIDQLAAGQPPVADEPVFADLRTLHAHLAARRQQLSE